jgi:hypothetical protein
LLRREPFCGGSACLQNPKLGTDSTTAFAKPGRFYMAVEIDLDDKRTGIGCNGSTPSHSKISSRKYDA